ncbi:MAG: DUF835 domain-containing protein [Theionarchaea archaeon]|nr:DUF835 domain-containing protein [Theionarchaea archaeon]
MEKVLSFVKGSALFDLIKRNGKSPAQCNFKMGVSYMMKEKNTHRSYEIFSQLVSGKKGLIITRVYPPRLHLQSPTSSEVFWLTSIDKDNTIRPADLDKLGFTITSFIIKQKEAVVLLDGIEYLILQNGFEKILNFLSFITDKISKNNAILLIPAYPKALDEKEMMLLERILEPC